MKLSVIIPVYNVASTLRRCVDSVLSQNVDGMEVILVDDGSTDGSSKLCDEYAQQGLTVIHQKNNGLSAARNAGLITATGDLVTFIDSDDYIMPDTYQPLLHIMAAHPDTDILEYSLVREMADGPHPIVFADHTYTDMAEYWLTARAYAHCYACNKIYRRQLFQEVRYPVGKKFEDVPTLYQLLQKVQTVRTTAHGSYLYTLNNNGITQRAKGSDLLDLLQAHLPILNDKSLQRHAGFTSYYIHVLNIQLDVYDMTGYTAHLQLPVLPFHKGLKLRLLHLLGLPMLCRLHRLFRHYSRPTAH